MYCVIENYDANSHFAFFFSIFHFLPSATPIKYMWTFYSVRDLSATA